MSKIIHRNGYLSEYPLYLRLGIEKVGVLDVKLKDALVRVEEYKTDELLIVTPLRLPVGDQIRYGLGGMFADQYIQGCAILAERGAAKEGFFRYRLLIQMDVCNPIDLLRLINREANAQNPHYRNAVKQYRNTGISAAFQRNRAAFR